LTAGSSTALTPSPVLFTLAAAPLELRGVTVRADRTPPLAQTVTTATVRQVPPLGEPDIFRAIVLLPGVSQPNDLKGRIHLAGGASDETGVRLDGHPLQEPFHLLGVLGAFNVAALERADVLIHHLPPSTPDRLSGIIDLESRRPAAAATTEAVVGLLSAGVTTSQPPRVGGLDVLASGRITYFDKLADAVAGEFTGSSGEVPVVGYRDAIVRVGRPLGRAWRVDALGFTTRDVRRTAGVPVPPGAVPLTWGETLGGLRVDRVGFPWTFAARASYNRATVRFNQPSSGGTFVGAVGEVIHINRGWASAGVEAAQTAARWRARGGASLDWRRHDQRWDAQATANGVFSPRTPAQYAGTATQTLATLFGDVSRDWGARWTGTLGSRLSSVGARRYVAPRAVLGFRPMAAIGIEAAADRRYQFDAQLEESIEGSVTQPVFLLTVPRRADVAAVSAEWNPTTLGTRRSGRVRVSVFGKRYRERTVLRAYSAGEPGDTVSPDFPDFDRVPGRSVGAALSARYSIGDRALVQGSYTYQRVEETIAGVTAPTAWDVPHAISLFGSVPLTRRWTLSAAFQGNSGVATTPIRARIFAPDPLLFGELLRARYLVGGRNSARLPPYRRLDLAARREWQARRAAWALSMQVINVLARQNTLEYDWESYFCQQARECSGAGASRAGLPLVPSVGIEVRW